MHHKVTAVQSDSSFSATGLKSSLKPRPSAKFRDRLNNVSALEFQSLVHRRTQNSNIFMHVFVAWKSKDSFRSYGLLQQETSRG
jgi:hypothetical protein